MKKLKSKFNQLKSIIKEAVKKQPLVDQEIDNIEVTAEILNSKEAISLINYDKMKAQKEHWENKYNSLLYDLQSMKKIEKQIKSRL